MNGCQRIVAALEGRWPDTAPVMLHNFMMAAREAGIAMKEYRRRPEAVARAFVQAVETYGYDGIVLDIDTTTVAGALGVPIDFPEDQPARCAGARLGSLDEVRRLPPPDVARYFQVQVSLEAARILKKHFGDEVHLRGNVDQAPFSLAAAMRGAADWLMDLMNPALEEQARGLLDYCVEACSQYMRLMAETGVHMLSQGDSPAGPDVASPALYRKFALACEQRMASLAHALGLPYAVHICGKTNLILHDMVETGSDALELDFKTDARLACRVLAGNTTFIGNIDPSGVLALGTPEATAAAVRKLLAVFGGTPRFILNAGCAIPADTPARNLRAMLHAART
jgi:uroporphyrinogen decarboxylase